MTEPKPGMRFVHANWLEPDYTTPLMCQVIQVNKDVVYYRGIYKDGTIGSAMYESLENFPKRVKEWVE